MRREGKMDTVGEEVTQLGISESLGIPRSHITRVMKPLVISGSVLEDKKHVRGRNRKLKVYSLTPTGIGKVQELLESVSVRELTVREQGRSRRARVGEILELPNTCSLELIDCAMEDGTFELGRDKIMVSDRELKSVTLYDRGEETAQAQAFLEGGASTLVILANRGYGSSSLMRRIALEMTDRPVLWHDLLDEGDRQGIQNSIKRFLDRMYCSDLMDLKETESLLCFDNYHLLADDGVDALIDILDALDHGRVKMVVAMRRENPSYNRFYQKADVDANRVVEIGLRRLDIKSMNSFFGPEIDPGALKLIYLLTRGQPLSLKLLREGDDVALRELYPNEEVRFMMYLRTKRKVEKDPLT